MVACVKAVAITEHVDWVPRSIGEGIRHSIPEKVPCAEGQPLVKSPPDIAPDVPAARIAIEIHYT
ncbi:hypothetical protein TUM12370_02300 [Salmonella enterica subsp. enterica serovar Choleraesuis]|nr:hypothetical protein TUM12370_02300 [Salmonella enterica subsp. enterica serovar Choleraesuis]